MADPPQSTSSSSETARFSGFVCLLLFLAVALYVIGPEVIADSFRKASGGLTTAEQAQAVAREELERSERVRLSELNRKAEIEREENARKVREANALAAKQKEAEQQQANRRILEDSEKSQYLFARGDLERLRLYLRDCVICDYQNVARVEASQLETEEKRRQIPAVTFRLKSNHPNSVAYAFYSAVNRSRVWPGGVLTDSDVHTERLSCEPGESVCYGAWVQGAFPGPFWGVGPKGKKPCSNCCVTCPSAESGLTITFEPRDAQVPLPDITWNIGKNFGGTLALSFYSASRRGLSWPGGGRVYVLNDQSSHQYELNCLVGEKICYGAWFNGNPGGTYWGAGSGGLNACTNCCSVCNGAEYTANLTFQGE
jgi:hypothetical protein